jgi:hypothetical protein
VYNPAGMIESGEALKNPPVLTRIAIRYKGLDPCGHVNNAIYRPEESFITEGR